MKNSLIGLLFVLFIFLVSYCKTPRGNSELSEKQKQNYLERGRDITSSVFLSLSSHLQQAMNSGGVPNAMEYCNQMAYPLTDSLSEVHNAFIKRTSLRVRNSNNEPDSLERAILMDFESKTTSNEELGPIVKKLNDGTVAYFAPIRNQGLCLSCHGIVGENLSVANDSLVKKMYPQDEATGYALNDLRGMWSIRFDK